MSPRKKLELGEVNYLSFEGGGAMGGAYLGAICALQDLDAAAGHAKFPGLLKKTPDGRAPDTGIGEGDIEGVSGASIGAVFGMCVAMGYTAEQVNARLISDKVMKLVTKEAL